MKNQETRTKCMKNKEMRTKYSVKNQEMRTHFLRISLEIRAMFRVFRMGLDRDTADRWFDPDIKRSGVRFFKWFLNSFTSRIRKKGVFESNAFIVKLNT
jgi:hypothetical protein